MPSFECPSCDAMVMTTGIPAGKSMRCPACGARVKVPANADDEDERDEIDDEDEAPRRKKSKKGGSGRKGKRATGPPLGLWLGIGGGVLAVVVVLVVVLGGKRRDPDQTVDKPGDPAPQAKEGGGTDAYTVTKRIDTNIPLPQREPYVLIRGIIGLAPSADAGVIAVTSALSPRRYTINRQTGQVISQFDEPEARDQDEARVGREVYRGGHPIISPDGKLLVVLFSHEILVRTIKIRDAATGNVVKTLGDAKLHHFHKVAFSPKGDVLYAIARLPGEIVLAGWSVANWQQVCQIKMPENREPGDLIPLADGKTVVTLTRAGEPRKAQVDFFDVREQKFTRAFVLGSWKETRTLTVSPDGKLVAVVGDHGIFNRALEVYDMDTTKHISTVVESKDITQPGGPRDDSFPQVEGLRFLPGGRLGVIGGHSTTGSFVATYDARTGAQKAIWKHNNEIGGRKITHLSFCANGEMLMVLDGDVATILVTRLKE